ISTPGRLPAVGGPGRVRTVDLFHAMEARSQLRHRPTRLSSHYIIAPAPQDLTGLSGTRDMGGAKRVLSGFTIATMGKLAITLTALLLTAGCGSKDNFTSLSEEFVYTTLSFSPTTATGV